MNSSRGRSVTAAVIVTVLLGAPTNTALAMSTPTGAPASDQTIITLYTQLVQLLQQELTLLSSSGPQSTDTAPTSATSTIPAWLQAWDQHAPTGYVPGFGGGGGSASSNISAPAPYVAQAVHFDLKDQIVQSAYTISDASSYTESFWIYSDDAIVGSSGFPNLIDGSGDYTNVPDTIDTEIGFNLASTDIGGVAEETGAPDASFAGFSFGSQPGAFSLGRWHHVFVSVDTNHPTGEKIAYLYVDGVSVRDPSLDSDNTTGAFSISFHNTLLGIPTSATLPSTDGTVDYADFQMWVGKFIDPTVPSNLDNFISGGRPVDPAIAAAAFGTQTLLFSGDANSFGTNQGNGGTFILAHRYIATGLSARGAISIPGAVIGQRVLVVRDNTNFVTVSSDFESTISVNNEIQQTATIDLSADTLGIVLSGGTLTNASTSPSH